MTMMEQREKLTGSVESTFPHQDRPPRVVTAGQRTESEARKQTRKNTGSANTTIVAPIDTIINRLANSNVGERRGWGVENVR
jgi:hypothetical protein